MRREPMLAQPSGVGIAQMVDPAVDARVQFGERGAAGLATEPEQRSEEYEQTTAPIET